MNATRKGAVRCRCPPQSDSGTDASPSLRLILLAVDPLVGSIATQFLNDRPAHDKTATEWTRRYAQG
jgi:hypothetical protein